MLGLRGVTTDPCCFSAMLRMKTDACLFSSLCWIVFIASLGCAQ